eukprot:jgi/Ulvmu1/6482/UM003_0113.1
MSAEQVRELKIKTGAVKRTTKEFLYYFKELETEKKRLEKMKQDGKDEYDLKQQENVVSETGVMIPETKKSLQGVLDGLIQCFDSIAAELADDSPDKVQAQEVLSAAKEAIAAN